ncbi:hypothetical protein HY988_04440 [Candidatus Micrarchaeota archaeon]|nr:hypothetical protein [Candidatus Micrarchaeota archaeon]
MKLKRFSGTTKSHDPSQRLAKMLDPLYNLPLTGADHEKGSTEKQLSIIHPVCKAVRRSNRISASIKWVMAGALSSFAIGAPASIALGVCFGVGGLGMVHNFELQFVFEELQNKIFDLLTGGISGSAPNLDSRSRLTLCNILDDLHSYVTAYHILDLGKAQSTDEELKLAAIIAKSAKRQNPFTRFVTQFIPGSGPYVSEFLAAREFARTVLRHDPPLCGSAQAALRMGLGLSPKPQDN